MNFEQHFSEYRRRLIDIFDEDLMVQTSVAAEILSMIPAAKSTLYLCGNGGSAGNANHLANDFLYCCGSSIGIKYKVESLASNPSIISCLANDTGYENIFSSQLEAKGRKGDVLLALSGSGNSKNIISALEMANEKGIKTISITGFTGGKAAIMSDVSIHLKSSDMQICEDYQMILGHMIVQHIRSILRKK